MAKLFGQVWNVANNIVGAFTQKEASMLWEELQKLPNKSTVVEIGAYFGRSTSIIATLAKEKDFNFTTVDNFFTQGLPEHLGDYPDVKTKLLANLNSLDGKYQLYDMDSKEASKSFEDESIDLLFVDGDHSNNGVKTDLKYWIPKVKKGTPILFHDYYGSYWAAIPLFVDQDDRIKNPPGGLKLADSMALKYKK